MARLREGETPPKSITIVNCGLSTGYKKPGYPVTAKRTQAGKIELRFIVRAAMMRVLASKEA
jgi:hypothetical protein